MEFPWTKREIIEAVIAERKPFDRDDPTSWAFHTAFRAFFGSDSMPGMDGYFPSLRPPRLLPTLPQVFPLEIRVLANRFLLCHRYRHRRCPPSLAVFPFPL